MNAFIVQYLGTPSYRENVVEPGVPENVENDGDLVTV